MYVSYVSSSHLAAERAELFDSENYYINHTLKLPFFTTPLPGPRGKVSCKGLFGFAVLLTRAHLRQGIFNLSVQFRSFLSPYPLELPLLASYFSRSMKTLNIKRCRSCNWIKIPTLVVVARQRIRG